MTDTYINFSGITKEGKKIYGEGLYITKDSKGKSLQYFLAVGDKFVEVEDGRVTQTVMSKDIISLTARY